MSNSIITCFCCGSTSDLEMFPQRKAEQMVGWIFVCKNCKTPDEIIISKEVLENEKGLRS